MRFIVAVGVQAFLHGNIILILQARKYSIVAHYVEQKDRNQDYREWLFQFS